MSWTNERYRQCLVDADVLQTGPLSGREYCDALAWIAEPAFPVGERNIPVFEPWHVLPQVVPIFTGTKEDLLHEPPVEQLPAPTEAELPVTAIGEENPFYHADGSVTIFIWNGEKWVEGPRTYPEPTYVETTETGGSMDLGQIGGQIIDIGLDALRARAMPRTQTVSYAPAAAGAIGRAIGPAAAGAAGGLGLAEVIDFPSKKKRRRRRRLATVSDIKDLAALKAVLGNGEAFKTWIATHSR